MKAWLELRRLPRRLWILAGASLINRTGAMALAFLPLYLIQARGYTTKQAAGIIAIYGGVAFVVGPFSGRLCDRWGTDRMMKGCLALAGTTMLLFPLARSPLAVILATIAWAAASESFRPAEMTAVSESAPPDMSRQAYALSRMASNLGMSLGPAIGGFVAGISFSILWRVNGITSLAAAALLCYFLPDARPAGAPAQRREAPSRRSLSDPRLRYCLMALVPVAMVFFQHESSLSVFLVRDLRLSASFYGLLFTLNTALIVAFEIPLNHATAHWSHRRTLALGSGLFAVGFGAHALATGVRSVTAAAVVWTFGEMILLPGFSSYISQISPADRRGEYLGLYTMSLNLAFLIGPWSGLLILDRWGPTPLWTTVFAAGLVSALLFAFIPEGDRRARLVEP